MATTLLCVAEKNDAAANLAKVMSNNSARKRGGHCRYTPIYEFQSNVPPWGNCNCIVTSVAGHLMDIDFNARYSRWRGVSPDSLFGAELEISLEAQKGEDIEKNLMAVSRGASVLLLWTDCDREGEAIGHEVQMVCQKANPRILVKRAHFSTFNHVDVQRALQTLAPLDMKQVDAVEARREVDLRIGAAFTRFQTMMLQDKFATFERKVVSFGPCQFPTLGFVVDRYKQIRDFVVEPFWSLRLSYTGPAEEPPSSEASSGASSSGSGSRGGPSTSNPSNRTVEFTWRRGRLFDRISCLILFEACVEQGTGHVASTTDKLTRKSRPVPLSTIEMQKRMNKYFRMSSQATMSAAEKLYQRGILSYPRTETEVFADSFDLKALVNLQRDDPQWGAYTRTLVDGNKFVWPRPGSHNDGAHPPIHPVQYVGLDGLAPDEKKVYEFVTRHFLACCSDDGKGAMSTVVVDLAGEMFSASGLMIYERNYLDVYTYDRWNAKTLPALTQGDLFTPTRLWMADGKTGPPKLLTEGELIDLMYKNGIGTDATASAHVETIQKREYASKVTPEDRFTPTTLGLALIDAYIRIGHEESISKPTFRAAMEADLVKVADGRRQKQDVVNEILQRFQNVFRVSQQRTDTFCEVLSQYFQPLGAAGDGYTVRTPNLVACGTCGHKMDLKCLDVSQNNYNNQGRRGGAAGENAAKFKSLLYCATCSKSHLLPGSNPDVHAHDHRCPLCNFQVVSLVGNSGNRYNICPDCYSKGTRATTGAAAVAGGAADTAEAVADHSGESMPCFKCSADCELAGDRNGSSRPVAKCPQCKELSLRCKKTSSGSWMLGCINYPACTGKVWYPTCVSTVSDPGQAAGSCRVCSSAKLTYKFERRSVPPGTELEQRGCALPSCAGNPAMLRELFEELGGGGGGGGRACGARAVGRVGGGVTRASATTMVQPPPTGGVACSSCRSFGHTARSCPTRIQQTAPPPTIQPYQSVTQGGRGGQQQQHQQHQHQQQQSYQRCTKCNLPGHIAYQCTARMPAPPAAVFAAFNGGGGSSGGNNCYKCQQPGHFANQCPGVSSGGGSSMSCYKCNQPGHFANNCPGINAAGAGGGGTSSRSWQQPAVPQAMSGLGGWGGGGGRGGRGGGRGGGTRASASQSSKPARLCTDCGSPFEPRKRTCYQCHPEKRK